MFLFSRLPFDIIREILLYDTHFVIRNRKQIICIDKIPMNDYPYTLYNTVPRIFKQHSTSWSVIMGKNKRYILWHRLNSNGVWEYSYVVYSKDPHTNMMSTIPEYETIIRDG